MCGITGIWDFSRRASSDNLRENARQMAAALVHRGPDDEGIFLDSEVCLALAHRRLSIIDLSDHGRQPMTSSCGRFTITYNGEIYNTGELADDLVRRGRRFRGHSDTEVLLEGCAEYGIEKFIQRVNGIFAFALYDASARVLWLCRDRMGVKPLYHGVLGGCLLFGSELKALTRHREFPRRINHAAVAAFLQNNYVPGDCSVYEGVEKVVPGTLLRFTIDGESRSICYWSLSEVVQKGIAEPLSTPEEAQGRLAGLLRDAVKRQMVSDVPLGGLLSGGVDSSLVVSMMQQASSRPVDTFTIGFTEREFNESVYAAAVARHLGTQHHEVRVSAEDAMAIIPDLPGIYDEPFSDSSQIPTSLLARIVRQDVTVALSGDGGDELFAGYQRYSQMRKVAQILDTLPDSVVRGLSQTALLLPKSWWRTVFGWIPRVRQSNGLLERGYNLASHLIENVDEVYPYMHCHWPDPRLVMAHELALSALTEETEARRVVKSPISRWQYLDMLRYLPDDILVKIDRASMASSLELRVPLLDHRVVELAWQIPEAMKTNGTKGKIILRRILSDYMPPQLFERPKMGFGIPLSDWMRGPLSSWVEDLINPGMVKKHGILKADAVWEIWQEHRSGRQDWGYWLWDLVSLQAWLEENSVSTDQF
jgi:asparagine synthase (glutamine-hydrolysing)